MATSIIVDGLATISIASPNNGSLETLGYSLDGVQITEQAFTLDVHGDEHGGQEGPPIDVQDLGQIHVIRMTLTKYDEAVLNKIRAVVAGQTAGTIPTAGFLFFQETKSFRLLINTPNRPRNYLNVIFREPREINKGTKHSQAVVVATAYKGSGSVLYNATVV